MSNTNTPLLSEKETTQTLVELDRDVFDHSDTESHTYKAKPGLSEELVREISKQKNEPQWMLDIRLKGLRAFLETPVPTWGPDLSALKFDEIIYYARPNAKGENNSWEEVPPEIKKTFDRLGIPQAEQKYLAGAGAQYDCLAEDTLVYTNPEGAKKIKNVKIGDNVFAYDEKTNQITRSNVLAVIDKGKREIFEVKVGGRTVNATFNHPFLTLADHRKPGRRRARYQKEWKYLNQLKEGDLIAIATNLPDFGQSYKLPVVEVKTIGRGKNQTGKTYSLDFTKNYNKVRVPEASSEDLMWLLGFYLGDGFIHYEKNKDKARIEFAIPADQTQLRDEVKSIVKKLFDYEIKSEDKDRISINSTILVRFIEKIGLKGKAVTKEVPRWIFTIPKSEKLAFLAGYLDADGNVRNHKTSKDVVLTSINIPILEKMKQLCVYCGLQTSKVTTFTSKHPVDKARKMIGHRLHISGNTAIIPSRHPMKSERLKLKKYYGKFNSANGTTIRKYCSDSVGFAKIESMKHLGEKSVYDISVEGYKNFVAEGVIVHNSDVVYHNIRSDLAAKGVIFEDMDIALQKYPDLVKEYFMTKCIPVTDHKLIMLHAAVWSGGTFIYIPKNVKVDMPLQAYFRMNAKRGGQFEHTIIVADEGSEIMYIEGCSAPQYSANSLHAGCVEIYVKKNARMRYSSVENSSKNTYNLNTKRAMVDENSLMEWVSAQTGSGVTMLYPCSVLKGEGAKADHISIAVAGKNQFQDTGAKVYHLAPRTSSIIRAKSISKDGGVNTFRGHVKVNKSADECKVSVKCDALQMDDTSVSNTFPFMKIMNSQTDVAHEATVGRIDSSQLFYLMSRGLDEEQAMQLIVQGFIENIVKELPLEYAVELNRLIAMEMESHGN